MGTRTTAATCLDSVYFYPPIQPLKLSEMLHLPISFMCCDLREGGGARGWCSISGQHTLLHSRSSPIINTQVLTGGSCSCNTTAISGLWNGGGTQGRGRKENEEGGSDWGSRLSLQLQLAAAVQTGFIVIALAAGHNPQHQGFS